jgi:hypothetical protein
MDEDLLPDAGWDDDMLAAMDPSTYEQRLYSDTMEEIEHFDWESFGTGALSTQSMLADGKRWHEERCHWILRLRLIADLLPAAVSKARTQAENSDIQDATASRLALQVAEPSSPPPSEVEGDGMMDKDPSTFALEPRLEPKPLPTITDAELDAFLGTFDAFIDTSPVQQLVDTTESQAVLHGQAQQFLGYFGQYGYEQAIRRYRQREKGVYSQPSSRWPGWLVSTITVEGFPKRQVPCSLYRSRDRRKSNGWPSYRSTL